MNAPVSTKVLPPIPAKPAPATPEERDAMQAAIEVNIDQIREIQMFFRGYRYHPVKHLPKTLFEQIDGLANTARTHDGILSGAVVAELRELARSAWRRRNGAHPPEEPILGICASLLANLNYKLRLLDQDPAER